jgi:hypothetical protein
MRIRNHLFTFMRVRILLLIKVLRICDHGSTKPPGLHFEPPRLHCERPGPSTAHTEPLIKIIDITFLSVVDPHHFDADSDPACYFDADPDSDPTFHFHADPDSSLQIKVQNLKVLK